MLTAFFQSVLSPEEQEIHHTNLRISRIFVGVSIALTVILGVWITISLVNHAPIRGWAFTVTASMWLAVAGLHYAAYRLKKAEEHRLQRAGSNFRNPTRRVTKAEMEKSETGQKFLKLVKKHVSEEVTVIDFYQVSDESPFCYFRFYRTEQLTGHKTLLGSILYRGNNIVCFKQWDGEDTPKKEGDFVHPLTSFAMTLRFYIRKFHTSQSVTV